ncbi:MAG: efflux RND transporter periplasmic adaptor subunit [Alphaproteobacteria bacterium]
MSRNTATRATTVVAAVLTVLGLYAAVRAGSAPHRFEPVSAEIPVGERVRVAARLVGPDEAAMRSGAVEVTSARLDMGPDGMAAMAAPLTPANAEDPGVLAFDADIVMAGRWALTVEARVRGDDKPVRGTVIFTAIEAPKPPTAAVGARRILYYRNPMGLPDVSPVPKKDWMGMDYIPVYEDEMSGPPGTVRVSLDKVQRAGVRTAIVKRQRLTATIRGAGTVTADEARLSLVTAKFDGFVHRLAVRTTGDAVRAGQPLMTTWIESGDLLRRMVDLAGARPDNGPQAETAARNLRLFDVPESVIAEIARTRSTVRTIPFVAPIAGTVLDKPAMDGMRFSAGDVLFRIADLTRVWIVVEVAEQDLGYVRVGQNARLRLPSRPGVNIQGAVSFIYPEINATTRAARTRIVVANPDGTLKLGLFAHAEIEAQVGADPAVALPASAVIDDGRRRVAFVAKGEGLFEPRDLTLGARAGDMIEVVQGLSEGDAVVVNGVFLIDAESNLQAALAAFTAGKPAQ